MSIEWSSDLLTGVAEIDHQHRELFSRVGKLSAACSAGTGKDEVLRLLLFLEEYVKEHFAAEEKLQLKHGFPDYAAHKSQHTRFTHDLARLKTAFQEEGATLSLVIMTNRTLAAWLVQHIQMKDKEFAEYLGETGGA